MAGLNINIRDNAAEVLRDLGRLGQRADIALQRAVRDTAFAVRDAEQAEIRRVFDRPTPYTLNGLRIRYSRTEIAATVWLKDELDAGKGIAATKYLAAQIDGGARRMKRFESALSRVGVLPAGWRAVPGVGATYDAFGNMSRGQIVQILSYFQAFSEGGYRANSTEDSRKRTAKGRKGTLGFEYFAAQPGFRMGRRSWMHGKSQHLQPGIYKRTFTGGLGPRGGRESEITPVLIFIRNPAYARRLDFFGVAKKAVDANFAPAVRRAIEREGSRA